MKLIHIINPFQGSAEHNDIQRITFESIRLALQYEGSGEVSVSTVIYKEDEPIVPNFIEDKNILERSIQDIIPGTNKKVPVFSDLFVSLQEKSCDYVIYSNADIAFNSQFYVSVKEFIKMGYDAFAINRRRISGDYSTSDNINLMYSEVGLSHPGYDCFVFRRELIDKFILGDACLGIPFIDSVILFNLIAFADNFKLFTNKHLTFHVGYELVKNWGEKELVAHNKKEYKKVLRQLKPLLKIKNIPGSGFSFFKRHFKWLMNPTIHYPTIALLDIKQWNHKRYQQEKEPIKGYFEFIQKKIGLD